MKKHYEKILKDTETQIQRALDLQVLDPASEFYGGFRDPDGLVEPKFAIYRITPMIACLFNPDSRFYGSQLIQECVLTGLEYIARGQRENGFFDLINCNFYSGPDTAFCLEPLIPVYVYLKRIQAEKKTPFSEREMLPTLLPSIESILLKGGHAMLKGGFHTPNHRWAMASVLMMLFKLTKDVAFQEGAKRFLIEGCDCNQDGEYAERSAGGYNKVNNDAMILLACASGDDTWYEPVKRNLTMMLTYLEPDGSIFTNNSTRQDRGTKVYPDRYYMEYLYMGIKFHNETFLKAANFIMEQAEEKGLGAMDCLIQFMLQPELKEFEYAPSLVPCDYCRHYEASGIVRIRHNSYSCSILKGSPAFLYFQHGDFTVSMKIGAGFCEHRNFIADSLTPLSPDEKGFSLKQKMSGWYYLPFSTAPDTSDWWSMDHSKREKLYGPDIMFEVLLTEAENGIDVRILTSGIDRAPLRVELAFDAGCRIESEHMIAEGIPGGGLVAKDGTITASKGGYAITAGPGFGRHNYTAGKFGSQGRSPQCFTVYFTDFTTFDHTISLRAVPAPY